MSRFIRGPVNPVKDGGPLTTRDLDRQDLAFLGFRASVFHGLRWIRRTLPLTFPPSIFRRKPTLARGSLAVIIWRMTDLLKRVMIYRTWTPQLFSCLHPIFITVALRKHGIAKMCTRFSFHADIVCWSSFGHPKLFFTALVPCGPGLL